MQDVLRVVVLPEPVVDAVQADVDELEVIPLLGLDQVPDDLELRPAHREDRVAEPGLVVGAEAGDVDRVVAHQLADLVGELGGMGEDVLVGVGREEAAHGQPVDLARRVSGRHADDDRPLPLAGQVVPDRRLGDRPRRGDAQARVGVIGPVAEAVDAQRAGVLAGGQAHPGRHRDRRDHALQPAVAAHLHQPADVRAGPRSRGAAPARRSRGPGRGSSCRIDSPSMAGPFGTPSAARIVGARSSEPRALAERPVHEQDAGHPVGVDDVVAAPLLHVVLERLLGDAPHRRRPRDAVPLGEVDQQVGRLGQVGPAVGLLAGHDAADRRRPVAGVGQARPGRRPARP